MEEISNNLKKNIIKEYNVNDIKESFKNLKDNCILIEIINNKMYYLEKKGKDNINNDILNMLHSFINKHLINNVTFIIDTNNKIIENKNYVLRLNKYDENENILFLPNNNNINIKKINWKEKKDRVYINKKYISEDNYNKLKDILNKEDFDFNENTNLEEINEYKYILYEENLETKNYELDILRLGTIIIKINENKIKTFYSDYIKLENNYIKYNINNNEEFEKLKEYKNKIKENTVLKIIENINNDLNILFNDEFYDNYLKNIFSRLSLKCESEQIINKRIYVCL